MTREPANPANDFVGSSAVPEPGQLVEARRRLWVVTDVSSGALPDGHRGARHLVGLSSLGDDSLGEELQVVWQLEAGARVWERAGLPAITGWDADERLEAFLDAVRWGAATNADHAFLQAPFRSGITIEDYQLDPLARALDMARVNLLIADDVGLGKTIEAGLVIQELLVRHRARTVFVVCPAGLQIKWRTEMREKFGLEFRIVDTEYVKRLRRERGIHVNPWTSYPRLVASMDWMKAGEGLRLLKDALPPQAYPRKFDILVVDEAHNVAPAAAASYALESQRTRLVRRLAPHFTHHLFLSATPHNGYQESFTSLLELLDDQRFARTVMPNEEQLHRVMVRRLKSDIVDAKGAPVFPERRLEALEVDYTEEERAIHALLGEYTADRAASVAGSTFRRYEFGAKFVHVLLKKRLFSSPRAFALTLAKHRETLERGATAAAPKFDERILRTAIARTEEDYADDEGAEAARDEAVAAAGALAPPLTAAQREKLDRLSAWAERARNRADSKAEALLAWLDGHLKTGGRWNEKRVILFTEYRATHGWLQEILAARDYGGERLMVLHGGLPTEEREKVKAAFQAHPKVSPVRILLATDAASEGIDLQNHCNYLIHVEIPWNPNVMEQRNGRIDRHGQKERAVFIWHPVGRGFSKTGRSGRVGDVAGDHEYLMRAALKVDAIRHDLGSVGPVIARQIEEAMLGRRADLNTLAAENKARGARRFVPEEKRLEARIARLHERLMEAKRDFHLSPEHIARAIAVGLELAEKPPLVPVSGAESGIFTVPELHGGSWALATEGLEHPHTGARRPITFDHDKARGRDDVVLAHLNHKLAQLCLRLLREEVWKLDDVKKLHRVAVRAAPDGGPREPVAAVWSRLVVTGGAHRRLHEELTLSGGELGAERFTRIAQVGRLEALVAEAVPLEPDERLFALLKERFERHAGAVMAAVEARSKERLRSLEKTLDGRKRKEILDARSVLDELAAGIERELGLNRRDDPAFLPGFSPEEIAQAQKDVRALKARLERIPREREEECAAVERHYADPVDRTFPAAVVFLVPQSMTGRG